MAITAATLRSDFSGYLSEEESAPIFDDAVRMSVVQQLAPRIPLGINGQKIPVVTSKPTASWTNEGGEKHKTNMGLGLEHMTPEKLTAIAVMSSEVVRANPGNYSTLLRRHLAEAFGTAFDYASLYNLGGDGTGTGPFDDYVDETTKAVELGTGTTVHNDIVAGLSLLVGDGKKLRGFAFDDSVEPTFLDAVDANNRPIYVDTPLADTTQAAARPGRLIGRPSFMGEGVGEPVPGTLSTAYSVGFGGDWAKTAWGVVGGISFRVSTEATVTINGELTSLWENNLVAVLAEAEYGWVMADPEDFVKYTETTPAA